MRTNPSLPNLKGLQNLQEVKWLTITGNNALESVDTLVAGQGGSLVKGTSYIGIVGNPSLLDCDARQVHDNLQQKPPYYCYHVNKADACSGAGDTCEPLPMP